MYESQEHYHTMLQLICFKLGHEEFGVDILKVKEIVPLQYIAHLPQTPETVAGIINLRGNLIPVINLRKKFGLNQIEMDDKTRIIVFSIADKFIGMIVDRVKRVFRMREDQFELPPDLGMGKIQDYVLGMSKADQSLIILIDIEKILTDEEVLQLEDLQKMKKAFQEEVTKKENKEAMPRLNTLKNEVNKPKKERSKKSPKSRNRNVSVQSERISKSKK
ncbi:purine-binding chemotaxis protein CheW [bacterium]|nr:purine-binding chemotaxis protein CheW [bacterium]